MNLLSVGHDAKTVKGEKKGYLTGILYLAPHTIGSKRTVCPFSTAGCRSVCLYSAGRGAFNNVQKARIRKTRLWAEDPKGFLKLLRADITELIALSERRGLIPAVRLNGTSDIKWEDTRTMDEFPDVIHYDYTKYPPTLRGILPGNYRLTYSYSEHPKAGEWSAGWLERGVNTSVVFQGELPEEFLGRPVINGDESDLRFTDPLGVIVGLKAKGTARKSDGAGFVQGGVI